MRVRGKLIVCLCLAGFGSVALPGGASAAVTFGSDLSQTPDTNCVDCAALTLKTSAGAELAGSPVNGVLVSARVRSAIEGGTGAFRILRATATPFEFLNVAEAPVTVTADPSVAGHVTEVTTQIPISIGDRLGVSFPDQNMHYIKADPDALCAYRAEPPIQALGAAAVYSVDGCGANEILVAGTVEPDNSVKVGKVKSLKSGKAKLSVTVPNAGVLTVTDAKRKKSKPPITLTKSASAATTGPGTITLIVKPSAQGRNLLVEKGKLGVSVDIKFTPNGGTAAIQKTKVKLKTG